MKATLGCFVDVCKRRELKDKAGESRVMVLGWKEGLVYEVLVDGIL